jgi:hypothetical protein
LDLSLLIIWWLLVAAVVVAGIKVAAAVLVGI